MARFGKATKEGGFLTPTVTETGNVNDEKEDDHSQLIETVGRGERI